jgi:hypothetical protein
MKLLALLTMVGVAFAQSAAVASPSALSASQARSRHLQILKKAKPSNASKTLSDLNDLRAETMPNDEKDHVLLSIGRIRYETGDFDGAVAAYSKVSHAGGVYLTAAEETAWAEFRRGKPEAAIAKLKTVTSPAFKDYTTSEPFFLMGLAELRVCDFKGLFKNIDDFKARYTDKVKALEAVKTSSAQAELNEIGKTVQKLNIVEAEAIQLLYLDENGKRHSGAAPAIVKDSEQLTFPQIEGDEFWLDELEGFQVTLKGCVRKPTSHVADSKSTTSQQYAKPN